MDDFDEFDIGDFILDEQNAREHNERNIGMIASSLNEVGAGRSILVDENNRIIAGNGTIEAAAIAGITRVIVVDTDGDALVAVRRKNLTEEQKHRMALYDNRTAELATWNLDAIGEYIKQSPETLDGIFTPNELISMMSSLDASLSSGDGDNEEEPGEGGAGAGISEEEEAENIYARVRKLLLDGVEVIGGIGGACPVCYGVHGKKENTNPECPLFTWEVRARSMAEILYPMT